MLNTHVDHYYSLKWSWTHFLLWHLLAPLPLDSNRGAKAAPLVEPAAGTTAGSLRSRLFKRLGHAHDEKTADKSHSSEQARNSEDLPV